MSSDFTVTLQSLWVPNEKTFEEFDATTDNLAPSYRSFQIKWRKIYPHTNKSDSGWWNWVYLFMALKFMCGLTGRLPETRRNEWCEFVS
jgi:hypothetical protein